MAGCDVLSNQVGFHYPADDAMVMKRTKLKPY